MMYHVLNPSIVGVAGGRNAIFPAHIILQFVLSPVRKIKRRISHNKIKFFMRVLVIKERVCLIRSEISINTADSHIHFSHFPSVGVRFLPIYRNMVAVAAVRLQKFYRLHKHTARTAARIINAAIIKRFQYLNNGFHNAGRGIKFSALSPLIRRKLGNAIFIGMPQQILVFVCFRHIYIVGKQVYYIAQNPFIQSLISIIFRQNVFQRFIFRLNSAHSVIND